MGGGGTTTSTTGMLDPTMQPLYRTSIQNLLGMQSQYPVSGFADANPEQVQGLDPLQMYAGSLTPGLSQPNPLQGLALQAMMQLPSMAYAGPTTGSPTSQGMPDIQSIMDMLRPPQTAYSPTLAGQTPIMGPTGPSGPGVSPGGPGGPPAPGNPGPYGNNNPNNPDNPNGPPNTPNNSGGWPDYNNGYGNPHHPGPAPALMPDSAPASLIFGHQQAAQAPAQGGGMPSGGPAPAGNPSWMDTSARLGDPRLAAPLGFGESVGSRLGLTQYTDPSGRTRYADPGQAGRVEGTNVHGQGVVDPTGRLQQMYFAPSQGQGPGQLGPGTMGPRPTDPTMAAAWDNLAAAHPQAAPRPAAAPQQAPNTQPTGGGMTISPRAATAPPGTMSIAPQGAFAPGDGGPPSTPRPYVGDRPGGGGSTPDNQSRGGGAPAPPAPYTPGGAPRAPIVPPDRQPGPPITVGPRPVPPTMPVPNPPPPGGGAPPRQGAPPPVLSGWQPGNSPAPGLVQTPWTGQRTDLYDSPGALTDASQFLAQGPQTTGDTPFYQSPGIQAAYQRVSGTDVANDPAVAAVMRDFEMNIRPGIENSAGLAGLGGTSSLQNAMARSEASMMTPLYQQALQREQDRLQLGYGATEEELGRRERASGRAAEAQQSLVDRLMGLSGQQYGQQQGAISTAADLGGQFRGIGQDRNDAAYQDMLRQQALAEQSLFLPFGQAAPSALGSRTISSGGK